MVEVFCCCTEESDEPRKAALLAGLAAADVTATVQELDAIRLDFSLSKTEQRGAYYAIYSSASPGSTLSSRRGRLPPATVVESMTCGWH